MDRDQAQKAGVIWRDGGVPVSRRFGDPYYSARDGRAESRHVFLAGNRLPERFVEGFHIAELGFGTGLNLLVAWTAWEASGFSTRLRFTGFEAFPMAPEDMARALGRWGGLSGRAARLLAGLHGGATRFRAATLDFRLVIGDARRTVPAWGESADAWFLDGFAPAKNPEMWTPGLMRAVAAHTAPGGTFATYTAAGRVRRALSDAGFTVTRAPGYASKRHMSTGKLA